MRGFGYCVVLWLVLLFAFSTARAQNPIPKDLSIKFERRPCIGFCGVYTVEIEADGDMTFVSTQPGPGDGPVTSRRKGHVTSEQLKRLVSEFRNIDFFSLRDNYGALDPLKPDPNCHEMEPLESSTVITSLQFGGRSKTVSHQKACRGTKVSNRLTALENLIDEVANTKYWLSLPPM